MKSPQQWKSLLENINFPNFNKAENEEVLEFIFSNCRQRDALLTWIIIQLGADFDTRISKHEAIIGYLKKRRIVENSKIKDFVEATLPRYDQEVIWDKLFSYLKMQKRLMPQLDVNLPPIEPPTFQDTDFNEKFPDLSGKSYLEPLYKEFDLLKKLRKIKRGGSETTKSVGEKNLERTEDYVENIDAEHGDILTDLKNKERAEDFKNTKKPEKKDGVGDASSPEKFLPTEQTTSGTWYCSPDGRQKVFVPIGAPPLGEFNFDSKTMKIVCEEDNKTESTEKEVKFAQKMEELEKRFKKLMKKRIDEAKINND